MSTPQKSLGGRLPLYDRADLQIAQLALWDRMDATMGRWAETPFIAADPGRPEVERLAALRKAFLAPGHDPKPWLKGWYPPALSAQREAVGRTNLQPYWFGGEAPLLEIIPRQDPFKPAELWDELRKVGTRVMTVFVEDAAHALFPEQPKRVAEAVLQWIDRLRTAGCRS